MKKLLILFLICFAQNTFSQEIYTTDAPAAVITEENRIYNTAGIDSKPQFPGGNEFLSAFLMQNYKNPKEGLKGRVYATFIIEKDGSLNDIKIIKDLGFGTKEEAIRVLKLSPKWVPGKLKGKEVRVLYSIPIVVE